MSKKTSIKIKKFWWADVAADGGLGTNWQEVQEGQREATVQFNGSDADTTNYKNVTGQTLESSITKGDMTMNFQCADLTAEVIAAFTGGVVSSDVNSTKLSAPANMNMTIEKSLRFLTNKNILVTITRASLDSYPVFNDDDLHYYQVNSVVLDPEKEGESAYTMEELKLPSENDIASFSFAEETGDATISEVAHTVAIEVENGTDPSALVPSIEVDLGASVIPAGGVANDFTNPVTYTVEAADGTTQDWTVTVTVAS